MTSFLDFPKHLSQQSSKNPAEQPPKKEGSDAEEEDEGEEGVEDAPKPGKKEPTPPVLLLSVLTKYSQVLHYKHPFRHIVLIPEHDIVLWLAAEAGGAKGFFDKITSFGAKAGDDGSADNGLFEGFRLLPDPQQKHKFQVSSVFKRGCRSAGICADWQPKAKLVAVGYENGEVAIYSYDPAKDPGAIKEIFIMKVKSNRILSVALNPDKSLVYVIAKGKKMKTVNYLTKTILTGNLESDSRNSGSGGRKQADHHDDQPAEHSCSLWR